MSLNIDSYMSVALQASTGRYPSRDLFAAISNRLRSEPAVSFVIFLDGSIDFAPELDVAVRLLWIAARDRPVDDGHLLWGQHRESITPASIESGDRAVEDCLTRLRESNQPFEFLAHIEGQLEIQVLFGPDNESFRLRQIAGALADEVGTLSS